MSTDTTLASRYDRRVTIVRDIVKQHSKLSDKAALAMAVHMVHALDTIPEKLR